MGNGPLRLRDEEILARLLTRREIARLGTMTAAIATAGLLGTRDDGSALAQDATDTPGVGGEGTIYRPATPVGSPQPAVTGAAETEVGPAPEAATPVAGVSLDAFMDLSLALVGGGTLDPQRGTQCLDLIAADPARLAALERLLAIRATVDAASPIATPVDSLADDDRALVTSILDFWYLGMFDDQPVEDRGGFWFGLSSWQAVRYTAAPSVCRAFGIWSEPPRTTV